MMEKDFILPKIWIGKKSTLKRLLCIFLTNLQKYYAYMMNVYLSILYSKVIYKCGASVKRLKRKLLFKEITLKHIHTLANKSPNYFNTHEYIHTLGVSDSIKID